MPNFPDPVLALLAIPALLLYFVVGSLVGVIAVRVMGSRDNRMHTLATRDFVDNKGLKDTWVGFGAATLLWPLVATMLSTYALFAVPFRVAAYIGSYVAGAVDPPQLKKESVPVEPSEPVVTVTYEASVL